MAAVVVALGVATLVPGPSPAGPGASPAAGAEEDTVVVTMTNTLTFEPDSVRIEPGATVLWKNTSVLIHTSTDDPAREAIEGDAVLPDAAESWNSGQLEPGESFAHTFTVPGEYHYFCVPHEAAGMKGVIRVQEPGS